MSGSPELAGDLRQAGIEGQIPGRVLDLWIRLNLTCLEMESVFLTSPGSRMSGRRSPSWEKNVDAFLAGIQALPEVERPGWWGQAVQEKAVPVLIPVWQGIPNQPSRETLNPVFGQKLADPGQEEQRISALLEIYCVLRWAQESKREGIAGTYQAVWENFNIDPNSFEKEYQKRQARALEFRPKWQRD